eukprot:TRINITY_DN19544_c0_g1_i1.p2 TRINITY_DN19544_c0_g1~~TRINITY_DN19544_c0_g1_i1.p2  ORF type:complete len:136 (+),score=30.84 TRINITY_DN19544_c0_g1_i1:41-409(+)
MCIRERYQRRVHGDFGSSRVGDAGLIYFLEKTEQIYSILNIKANNNFISEKIEKLMLDLLVKNKHLVKFASVSYTHLTLPTKRIVQISVVALSLQKKNGRCMGHDGIQTRPAILCAYAFQPR